MLFSEAGDVTSKYMAIRETISKVFKNIIKMLNMAYQI